MILLAAIFYPLGLASLLLLFVRTAVLCLSPDDALGELRERDEDAADAREREDREREYYESERLRDLHLGDPAYDGLHSPARIRRQEERDREWDRA